MVATPTVDGVLNGADTLNGLTNKFVVSPIFNLGVAGFVFDIPKETRIQLESESTDHFAEDNSAIQDHIALRPNIITTGGFVAELKFTKADPKQDKQKLVEKLVRLNSLVPVLTNAARSAKNAIDIAKTGEATVENLEATTQAGLDIFKAYKALNPPEGEQAKAFNFFRAMRDARQLVAVDTPWGFFSNLEIKTIIAVQSADSESVTDFSMVFKEFRTVQTQFVPFAEDQYQGRAKNQRSEQQDQGKAQGKKQDDRSAIKKLVDKFTGN